MITADFCILPMGIESSEIGEYVAEAVEVIKASGIKQYLKWVLEESTAY